MNRTPKYSNSEVRRKCSECGHLLAEFHEILPQHKRDEEPNSLCIEWVCPHCLWYDANNLGFKENFFLLGGHDMIRRNHYTLYALRKRARIAFMPSRALPKFKKMLEENSNAT